MVYHMRPPPHLEDYTGSCQTTVVNAAARLRSENVVRGTCKSLFETSQRIIGQVHYGGIGAQTVSLLLGPRRCGWSAELVTSRRCVSLVPVVFPRRISTSLRPERVYSWRNRWCCALRPRLNSGRSAVRQAACGMKMRCLWSPIIESRLSYEGLSRSSTHEQILGDPLFYRERLIADTFEVPAIRESISLQEYKLNILRFKLHMTYIEQDKYM